MYNAATKLTAILEDADHGLVILDRDGTVEASNLAAQSCFGPGLQVGSSILDIGEEAACYVELAQALEDRVAIECEFKDENGNWFRLKFNPIHENRQFVGASLMIRDIAADKQVREQLRYQAMLLESVSDAIISTNIDFKIVSWNQAAEQMYRWGQDEVLGTSIAQITQMEYVDTNREEAVETLFRQGYWEGEVIQRRRDGARLHIHSKVTLLYDEDGNTVGAVAINRDITRRKQIEAALRDSEMRYRVISELIADYVYTATLDRQSTPHIEWIRGKFGEISGYTFEELKGLEQEWLTVMHPDDLAAFEDLRADLLSNQPVVYDYRIFTKSGAVRWLRDYMQPIWDETDNRVVRILGAVQDITHARQAEQARERELRTLEKLSGSPRAAITAGTYGVQPLHEDQPDIFENLVQVYVDLLEHALEAQIYRLESHLSESLRALAGQLGSLRASPRDVVELHARALRRKAEDNTALRVQAYTDEGRLMLIELMGYLVTYYRNYAVPSRRDGFPIDE